MSVDIKRRLDARGPTNRRLAIDADGAILGPDCILVRRTGEGFRCVAREAAALIQNFLFGGEDDDPNWLFGQCRRIAKTLDEGNVALAQIYGVRIPLEDLDVGQVLQLARAAPFIKANFNPDEPRIPAGSPDGGQWTDEGETDSPVVIPVQGTLVRPMPLPWDVPYITPRAPTEIAPIPFDFPGAERPVQPPINPYPNDPECAEEWAYAYRVCDKARDEGKFRPGRGGPGKDYQSCVLGLVSERCGGNPVD